MNFFHAHPALATLMCYYGASAFVSSLPAPNVKSSAFYGFFFKFVNTLAANISRAYSSEVEKSPNFQDAVKLASSLGGKI